MKFKKAGVGNLGAEEVAQTRAKVLTRETVRAEADALFSDAGKARAKDRALLDKLFIQAPAAETMSPQLAKTAAKMKVAKIFGASRIYRAGRGTFDEQANRYIDAKAAEKPTHKGLAIGTGAAVGGAIGAGLGYAGAHFAHASPATKAKATAGGALLAGALGARGGRNMQVNDDRRIRMTRTYKDLKALDARGNGTPEEAEQIVLKHLPELKKHMPQKAPELKKAASVYEEQGSLAPNTHAFFDKLAETTMTTAQRRYPELLKASAAPGVGSVTTPAVSKRAGTATRGASPAQSSLSGGAA